jgi:hypothetical protein
MNKSKSVTYRGRYLGLAVLTVVQIINGLIHTISGLILIFGSDISIASSTNNLLVFSFYTLTFGILTIFITIFLWKGNRWGWIGTIAISFFVIVADILTIFDFLTFLGIIKIAGIGEIPYCMIIIFYLIQNHVRSEYNF